MRSTVCLALLLVLSAVAVPATASAQPAPAAGCMRRYVDNPTTLSAITSAHPGPVNTISVEDFQSIPVGPTIPDSTRDPNGFMQAMQTIYGAGAGKCAAYGHTQGDLIMPTASYETHVLVPAPPSPSPLPWCVRRPVPNPQTLQAISYTYTPSVLSEAEFQAMTVGQPLPDVTQAPGDSSAQIQAIYTQNQTRCAQQGLATGNLIAASGSPEIDVVVAAATSDGVQCLRQATPPSPPAGGAVLAVPLNPSTVEPNVVVIAVPGGADDGVQTWRTGLCGGAVVSRPTSIAIGDSTALEFTDGAHSLESAWGAVNLDGGASPLVLFPGHPEFSPTVAQAWAGRDVLRAFARYKQSCRGCDLAGVSLYDFQGGSPSANTAFSGSFSGANLSGATANGQQSSLYLAGWDFSNANLSNVGWLRGAGLSGANLSGANLSGTDLAYADVAGTNLTGANLSQAVNLLAVTGLNTAGLNNANLSGVNLSGVELYGGIMSGADLSGANLSNANAYSVNLDGANLSGANLGSTSLEGANLRSANLSGAIMSGAELDCLEDYQDADGTFGCLGGQTDLRGANLQNVVGLNTARMSGVLTAGAVGLRGADLSGAVLRAANLSRTDLSNANLSQANLGWVNLEQTNLSGANLAGAQGLAGGHLHRANLTSAGLQGTNLQGADLTGATLTSADLSGANLQTANLGQANLHDADLTGASLSGATLTQIDLSAANLSGGSAPTNLTGVDMSGGNLSGATGLTYAQMLNTNLSGANLTATVLSSAQLDQANLTGTDLSGADLSAASLTGAIISGPTISGTAFNRADLRGAQVTDLQYVAAPSFNDITVGQDNSGACTVFQSIDFGAINLTLEPVLPGCENTPLLPGSTVPLDLASSWLQQELNVNLTTARFAVDASNRSSMSNLDLHGVNLSGVAFVGWPVDLSGTNLNGANLAKARLAGAELGGATLQNVSASGASFRGARLAGSGSQNGASFSGSSTDLTNADFVDAEMSGASFVAANVGGAVFDRVRAVGPDFNSVRAAGASFVGAHISDDGGQAFDNANDLSDVNFSGAVLVGDRSLGGGFDLTRANLSGAKFDYAQCIGCNFTGSNLDSASFSQAYVMGAVFSNATMQGVDMSNAWLYCGDPNNSQCARTQDSPPLWSWPLALGEGEDSGDISFTTTDFTGVSGQLPKVCPDGTTDWTPDPDQINGSTVTNVCRGHLQPVTGPTLTPACSSAGSEACPTLTSKLFDTSDLSGKLLSLVPTTPPNWSTTLSDSTAYLMSLDDATVRKVSGDAEILAGTSGRTCPAPTQACGDGGPASQALLGTPSGLAVGLDGSLFIADSTLHRVRRVDPSGHITTVAGSGQACTKVGASASDCGNGDAAIMAQLMGPYGVWIDPLGKLVIADGSAGLRQIGADGSLSLLDGTNAYDVRSVVGDASGSLFAAAQNPDYLIQVDSSGKVSVAVGTGTSGYNGNSDPTYDFLLDGNQVQISDPGGLAVDQDGNILFADRGNNLVRAYVPQSQHVMDPLGGCTDDSGNPKGGFNGDSGWADQIELSGPVTVTSTAGPLLVVADSGNKRLLLIGPSPQVSTTPVCAASFNSGGSGDDSAVALSSARVLSTPTATPAPTLTAKHTAVATRTPLATHPPVATYTAVPTRTPAPAVPKP